jgi:hypothetical protein
MLKNNILNDILMAISNDKEWLLGGLLLMGVLFLFVYLGRQRSSSNPLTELMEAISVDSLSNIVLFDDMN